MSTQNRQFTVAFVSGVLFAIGLGLAGMTNPAKVLAFLDVLGDWDPSLAFVMGGAIAVYAPVYRKLKGRDAPKFAERFHWPTAKDVDRRLIIGSILFGVGWGLGGLCPGPAVVAVTGGTVGISIFFVAMITGMLAQRGLVRALEARQRGN
jgi:uncharacterized membrane protein YedE/YeeE